MSQEIKTGWLEDNDGNKLAPKTIIGEVLNTDGTTFNPVTKSSELENDIGFKTTDTKNTTGATNTTNDTMYLIGSKKQADESQTYTDEDYFISEDHKTMYGNGYSVRDSESGAILFNASIYGDNAKKDSTGIAQITVGSSRDSSQDGSYIGHVYQYSKNGNYTDLVPSETLNNNPVITLPSSTGTLALTKELPTVGNGSVTIRQAGAVKGTFSTNQSNDTIIDLLDSNTNTIYSAGIGLSLSNNTFKIADACTSITDWNNAVTNGYYMGNNISNQPIANGGWFYGIVITHNTKYVRQIVWHFATDNLISSSSCNRYERVKHDDVWGDWLETTVKTSVPSDAKFTDTNTWRGIQDNLTSDSTTDSLSAAQGKVLKGLVDGKQNFGYYTTSMELTGTVDSIYQQRSNTTGGFGSISLVKKSSGIGSEIPAGWYNYIYSPHRTGVNGVYTDNNKYATVILFPMTFSGTSYIIRYASGAIAEVKPIITSIPSYSWSEITNKPTSFEPKAHTHSEYASKEWTFVGNGTSVDISNVYSKAYEWYVAVLDANQNIVDFNIPYNRFSISDSFTHSNGYYYDANYYATISLLFSQTSISIRTAWTKIQYGEGKTTNTAEIYVYYR